MNSTYFQTFKKNKMSVLVLIVLNLSMLYLAYEVLKDCDKGEIFPCVLLLAGALVIINLLLWH